MIPTFPSSYLDNFYLLQLASCQNACYDAGLSFLKKPAEPALVNTNMNTCSQSAGTCRNKNIGILNKHLINLLKAASKCTAAAANTAIASKIFNVAYGNF